MGERGHSSIAAKRLDDHSHAAEFEAVAVAGGESLRRGLTGSSHVLTSSPGVALVSVKPEIDVCDAAAGEMPATPTKRQPAGTAAAARHLKLRPVRLRRVAPAGLVTGTETASRSLDGVLAC